METNTLVQINELKNAIVEIMINRSLWYDGLFFAIQTMIEEEIQELLELDIHDKEARKLMYKLKELVSELYEISSSYQTEEDEE